MERMLPSKIKFAVRVRPALDPNDRICVSASSANDDSSGTVSIFNHKNIQENISYHLPNLFDSNSSQKDLYSVLLKPEVKPILEGRTLSVFTYGPPGSGKTHTMLGSANDPGIIPRLAQDLFDTFSNCSSEYSFKMTVSYLEIHNEKIRDLMTEFPENLVIRQDAHQNIFVANLTEKEVDNFEDFSKVFVESPKKRVLSEENANSSDRHTILMLTIIRTEIGSLKNKFQTSKVFLVDLAGSNNNQSQRSEGKKSKDNGIVNKSLFVFTDVIAAINEGNRHVPFRNSQLTRLLQNSLSGSSRVVMIGNISPEENHYHATYCTLNFISKQRKIVNNPSVGELAAAFKIKLPHSKQDQKINEKKKELKSNHLEEKESINLLQNLQEQMLKMEQTLKSPKREVPCKREEKEQIKKRVTRIAKIKENQNLKLKTPPRLKDRIGKDFKKHFLKDDKKEKENSKELENDYLLLSEIKQNEHQKQVLKMLNSCSENDLMLLHTVGKKRAEKIMEWRRQNKPFQQIEDLIQIPDLGEKYLNQFLYHNHLTDMKDKNF